MTPLFITHEITTLERFTKDKFLNLIRYKIPQTLQVIPNPAGITNMGPYCNINRIDQGIY